MDEFHERQLLRLKLGLPDEYIFKQCDEGEEIIAESILWRADPVERPLLAEVQLTKFLMMSRRLEDRKAGCMVKTFPARLMKVNRHYL